MKTTQAKYVVITGASSGIGYEAAKAFAARGKNLIVVARRQDKLRELKKEILQTEPSLDVIVKVVDLAVNGAAQRLYWDLKGYWIDAWINSAGLGNYDRVADQNLQKVETMLRCNVEALTVLSSLYVQDYHDVEGTQLINISSAGGYTLVPTAVTYCATKFYVSAFTEGLARELREKNARLQAKVLAPAATKSEFGKVANNVSQYDYDRHFGTYHSSQQMAAFLLELYDSDKTVGLVDREKFTFKLSDPLLAYAGKSAYIQVGQAST